jgi:hypothetical protein
MQKEVRSTLEGLNLGEAQLYRDLCVFPVLARGSEGPTYLTLEEAVEADLITVTEVSEDGSVPHLKVVSRADRPILLLDGEELQGAKQNRVLNTTVLLAPHTKTVVPVSCTEHGRWSYETDEFAPSENVMDYNIRGKKMRSVSRSLEVNNSYESDQGQVWDEIADLSVRASVSSPTGAMKDVFTERKKDYDDCLRAFPLVEGQVGLVAFVNGRPAGLDVLSSPRAFALLHDKLVRSYASDTIMRGREDAAEVTKDNVQDFVARILACRETGHDAVSLGEDYRYTSRAVCGSALVFEETCIHAAFFASEADEQRPDQPSMSSLRMRRGFRDGSNN